MNASEWGKRLGIGVRVAGRVAQQHAERAAQNQASSGQGTQPRVGTVLPSASQMREATEKTQRITRAAGRGVGGFLRPFGRVGGILWLEMTGFFFGLFALYFATDLWKTRASYAAGPEHSRFLIAAALTVVFGYLSASAFWRVRRK